MTGDDLVRHCGQCNKNVFNLSGLSADAAANLFREKEGKLCVRFYRRYDGTVLTADCPVGRHHRIRRMALLAASFAGLLSLAVYETAGPNLRDDLVQLFGGEKRMCMGEPPPMGGAEDVPELLPPPRELGHE